MLHVGWMSELTVGLLQQEKETKRGPGEVVIEFLRPPLQSVGTCGPPGAGKQPVIEGPIAAWRGRRGEACACSQWFIIIIHSATVVVSLLTSMLYPGTAVLHSVDLFVLTSTMWFPRTAVPLFTRNDGVSMDSAPYIHM